MEHHAAPAGRVEQAGREVASGPVVKQHPVLRPNAQRLQRLHQRLGPGLPAGAEQAAPVAQAAEERPELDRCPGGLVTEPEVRDELVDGHEARGGSSTCVRVRPPVELTVALDATLWDEPTTGIARYGHAVAGALEARGVRVLRVGARRSGELPRHLRSRTL